MGSPWAITRGLAFNLLDTPGHQDLLPLEISARTPWFRPSADQPCGCHNRMVLSRISAPRSGGRFACRELATPDLDLIKQAKQAVWLGDLLDPGGTLLRSAPVHLLVMPATAGLQGGRYRPWSPLFQ